MNKEKFMIYQKTHIEVKCRECERLLALKHFSYRDIHEDNTGICRACGWIINNSDKMKNSGYSYQILETVVRYIFEIDDGDHVLNELQGILNMSLDEIISIVQHLSVGNKPYRVRVSCECCGKDVVVRPSKIISNQNIYCSNECYWKDKPSKIPKGEENLQYNRIETNCTNCGKPMKIIPSHYNKVNRFNDNHNFCCQECYWEYRSKYYVNEKSNGSNIEWTQELRNKVRRSVAATLSSDDRLNTKPQNKVNEILDELKIPYIREYACEYYSVDNYLPTYNLMIEVMGDYWHANPLKFNQSRYLLNKKQLDGIHRDKLKRSYILNHYGVPILYLWETDILKRSDVCKKLILEYVNSGGLLSDYHSFNYQIVNDKVCVGSKTIIPYQNQNIHNYKNLLKQTS